jgi:hypothetical protein
VRIPFVLIVAVIAALTLAACGGGSSNVNASGTTATSTTTAAGGRGFRNSAFTTCLKQHGVTLPSGPRGTRRGGSGGRGGFLGGAGLSSAGQAAFSACQSKLPAGGFGGRSFAGGASATQITAYLSCLRDHGVRVPTTTSAPRPGGGSGSPRLGNALRSVRSDPHFAAASKTCAVLLPARGATTPTTAAGG